MQIVGKGASRQEAHEQIRVLSPQTTSIIKNEGKRNGVIERIRNTEYFGPIHADLESVLDPALWTDRSAIIPERVCAEAHEKLSKCRNYPEKAGNGIISECGR
jgi:adenylosuccinate lyase